MHKVTLRVKDILGKLNDTDRALVSRELLELLKSRSKNQVPSASVNVRLEAIVTLLKDKCDLVAEVVDDQSSHINLSCCLEVGRIAEGLKRVTFDFENYGCKTGERIGEYKNLLGPRYFGKIPAVGCAAGGDWEYPVFFIVFLDANGQTLRSYIPKGGNVWNYNTNDAFGNDDESDAKFLEDWAIENLPNIDKVALARLSENVSDNAWVMFDE